MFRKLINATKRRIIRADPLGLSTSLLALCLQRLVEMEDARRLVNELREDVQERIDEGDTRYEDHAAYLDKVTARMTRYCAQHKDTAQAILRALVGNDFVITNIDIDLPYEDAELVGDDADQTGTTAAQSDGSAIPTGFRPAERISAADAHFDHGPAATAAGSNGT